MTFDEFKTRVIEDGLAEVREVYAEDEPKREGAIEGFETARRLSTREAFEAALHERSLREHEMRCAYYEQPAIERDDDLSSYWRFRWGTLQVEWVYNVLLVAFWSRPGDMISSRAAMKAAEVLP